MPKLPKIKLAIHLDLLKPQSKPEQLSLKLVKWLLSSGRYIFIFVEAIVLTAFIVRFKLDADLQTNKEAIEQQIPYIESLKPFEILIRQTQFKLSTIDTFYKTYADYPKVIKIIADQTPGGVKIISLNLEKSIDKITIRLNGQAQNNKDLATFLGGLKQNQSFTDTSITSIGFEKGNLTFSLSSTVKLTALGGKI